MSELALEDSSMSSSCGCGGGCACHANGAFPPPCDVPGGCGLQPALDAMRTPARRPLDSRDLWKWVDRLTLDRRQRLVRQERGSGTRRVEYVEIPSLCTQLGEALASSNSGGGRGKSSAGSRSPLDLAIEALLMEISNVVADALVSHGHKPRVEPDRPDPRPTTGRVPRIRDEYGPTMDPDLAGRLVERAARATADEQARDDLARFRHDTSSDLRQLATVVVGIRDQDLVDWWADRYRWWVARAEAALTADDESVDMRGVRGHACPTCRTLWVTSEQRCEVTDRTPFGMETFREPALVIAFRDGQVLHITCRACSAGWWRGDDVDQLTRALALQTAVMGPAGRWGTTVPRRGAQ